MPQDFAQYSLVQAKAKRVLGQITERISSRSTEKEISNTCIELLAEEGILETLYYQVPALVLLGSRSCLSISGRDYEPSEEVAGENNLVTIDLSPLTDQYWGDCARSFVLEKGAVTKDPKDEELEQGQVIQDRLHQHFTEVLKPDSSFEDVFEEMNSMIEKLGYRNLDFLGNVGHSIVMKRDDRIYFEKGNKTRLKEVGYFTFEPHICRKSGKWGFKHENIYYFDKMGKVSAL